MFGQIHACPLSIENINKMASSKLEYALLEVEITDTSQIICEINENIWHSKKEGVFCIKCPKIPLCSKIRRVIHLYTKAHPM